MELPPRFGPAGLEGHLEAVPGEPLVPVRASCFTADSEVQVAAVAARLPGGGAALLVLLRQRQVIVWVVAAALPPLGVVDLVEPVGAGGFG